MAMITLLVYFPSESWIQN